MDGSSSNISDNHDSLLYHNGHAYRLLPSTDAIAGCFHLLKFGAREGCRAFFENIAHDLAMRERLRLDTLRWVAYFGEGVGYDYLAWLTEQVFTGRLGLYEVVCSAPPRGEPKPLEEKKVRAAVSAVADNLPVVGSVKSALQMVTGTDLGTGEAVSRWGAAAGIALGLAPGGKLLSKVAGKKISEKLGEKGLKQAQENSKHAPDERFNKRYHGPDAMTRDKNGSLTEWEAKGTQDGNTRVATDKFGSKQGSKEKNRTYAKKMLGKEKKIGKPSNNIGGPYTTQEIALWQEVKDRRGSKQHMSAHTNTETGQVQVFERDSRGNIVKQTDGFKLDNFESTKQKLIEGSGE